MTSNKSSLAPVCAGTSARKVTWLESGSVDAEHVRSRSDGSTTQTRLKLRLRRVGLVRDLGVVSDLNPHSHATADHTLPPPAPRSHVTHRCHEPHVTCHAAASHAPSLLLHRRPPWHAATSHDAVSAAGHVATAGAAPGQHGSNAGTRRRGPRAARRQHQ